MTRGTEANGRTKKRSATEIEGGDSADLTPPAKKIFPIFKAPSRTGPDVESSGPLAWKRKDYLPSTCWLAESLNPEIGPKIAAFDLDGTVIEFLPQKQEKEWRFWRKDVPQWLRAAHEAGNTIVIFSNQLYAKERLMKWREKIGFVARALDVPFVLFASTARDGYRKPMPGMWAALERLAEEAGVQIDKQSSFYVGDAAGRKGDHASTDRKYADNVGLKFFTPEEYFLKQPSQSYKYEGARVTDLVAGEISGPKIAPASSAILPSNRKQPEMVLFVGPPASGKTTFFQSTFLPAGYAHVNQDKLGSRPKCLKAAEAFVKEGVSCVIDNTNRDKKTRRLYLDSAESLGVPVRCFNFKLPRDLAWHNNLYRTFCLPLLSGSRATETKDRKLVPYSAILLFFKEYEEPTIEEGFQEVKTINWQFEGNAEQERYWRMWLQIDGK